MASGSDDQRARGTAFSLRVTTSGLQSGRTLRNPSTAAQTVELTTLDRCRVQATIHWSCERTGAVIPVGAAFPMSVPTVRRKRGFLGSPTKRNWIIKIGQGCADMNATLSVSVESGALPAGRRSWIPDPTGPITIDLHLVP